MHPPVNQLFVIGWRRRAVAVLTLLLLPSLAQAQSFLTHAPTGFGGINPVTPASSTNQAYLPSITHTVELPPVPKIFQWGPVDFRPHFLYRFVYGDGIPAAPGHALKTVINEVYPGASLNLGDQWTLDYTPTLRYYSNPKFKNVIDEHEALDGHSQWRSWFFALSQSYEDSTQPLVETGEITKEQSYLTSLTAVWAMNSKLSLDLGFVQDFRFVTGFQSLEEWQTPDWIDYHINPQLSVGIGPGLGYDALGKSPSETFEQGQARMHWTPGTKLTLQISGGVEDRQLGGGAPDLVSPIFGVEIAYQMLPHTRFELHGNRTVTPSVFQDQVLTITSVSGLAHQDISAKWSVDVSGAFANRPYLNTALVPISGPYINGSANQVLTPTPTTLLQVERVDNSWSVDVHLRFQATPRAMVEFFYAFTENSSGVSVFSDTSTQVGFSLGYRF